MIEICSQLQLYIARYLIVDDIKNSVAIRLNNACRFKLNSDLSAKKIVMHVLFALCQMIAHALSTVGRRNRNRLVKARMPRWFDRLQSRVLRLPSLPVVLLGTSSKFGRETLSS